MHWYFGISVFRHLYFVWVHATFASIQKVHSSPFNDARRDQALTLPTIYFPSGDAARTANAPRAQPTSCAVAYRAFKGTSTTATARGLQLARRHRAGDPKGLATRGPSVFFPKRGKNAKHLAPPRRAVRTERAGNGQWAFSPPLSVKGRIDARSRRGSGVGETNCPWRSRYLRLGAFCELPWPFRPTGLAAPPRFACASARKLFPLFWFVTSVSPSTAVPDPTNNRAFPFYSFIPLLGGSTRLGSTNSA